MADLKQHNQDVQTLREKAQECLLRAEGYRAQEALYEHVFERMTDVVDGIDPANGVAFASTVKSKLWIEERLKDSRRQGERYDMMALSYSLAADLLEMHVATGISLDHWPSARLFVEKRIDGEIIKNGA